VRAQPGAVGIDSAILLASLALLATVVALRTHREFERIRGATAGRGWRILSAVPWELLTSGLAVLGWSRPATGAGSSRTLNPLPQVDPLALTYPVFVVLTVGLLVARIAWLLLHVSHHARFWSRPALQLAIRRLAGARGPVTGVLVIGVLAIGTLATGSGIAAGQAQAQALATKSGIFVGANSRVDIERPVGTGARPLPAALRDNSTLVVDPATFSRSSATAGPDTESLHRLDAPAAGGVAAPRVGHTDRQRPDLPGLPPAITIEDVPVFPIIGGKPGYVISRNALNAAQLSAVRALQRAAENRVRGARGCRHRPAERRQQGGRAASVPATQSETRYRSVLQAVAGSRHRLWRWVDRVSPRAVHDENAGMTSLANNRADDMTWSPGMPGSAVQDVISVTPSSSRSRATCAIASSGVPMM
jgi:hypothetical protein